LMFSHSVFAGNWIDAGTYTTYLRSGCPACSISIIANTWVVLANLTCGSILKLVQAMKATNQDDRVLLRRHQG
jgi:hypothetical protein